MGVNQIEVSGEKGGGTESIWERRQGRRSRTVKALHLQCALSATTTALLQTEWYTPPQIHVCKCVIPTVTGFGGRALREVTGLNEVIWVGS